MSSVKEGDKVKPTFMDLLPLMMTRQFISLYVMNFFSIFLGLFIANEYKLFWQNAKNPPEDQFTSSVGSIGSVFNGMRFIWSALLDHFEYKTVYGILLVLEISLGVTYPLIIDEKWLVGIWICLGYWCLGGHFTLVPNEMKKIFGENTTQLYSYFYTYGGITGIVECVLQILVMTQENLYIFYYLYAGFAFMSLIMLIFWYDGTPITP
jgi:hypothetical protein